MLDFYPTLYEGELWYSSICRYHVKSGGTKLTRLDSLNVLFHQKAIYMLNPTSVNSSVYQITSQLPEGVLYTEQIILNNTLFPYITRFYPLNEKRVLLKRLCDGEYNMRTYNPHTRKSNNCLYYCPLCVQEDRNKYGEAYWHTIHQIPHMECCNKHLCRLKPLEITYHIVPLETQLLDLTPEFNISVLEKQLAEIQETYLTFPYSISPPDDINILPIIISKNISEIHRKKSILQQLYSAYETPLIQAVYGKKGGALNILSIMTWTELIPLRYALLQALANIDSKTMFNIEVNSPTSFRDRMLRYCFCGKDFKREVVAKNIGVSPRQLTKFALKIGLPLYWDRTPGEQMLIKRYIEESQVIDNRENTPHSGSSTTKKSYT